MIQTIKTKFNNSCARYIILPCLAVAAIMTVYTALFPVGGEFDFDTDAVSEVSSSEARSVHEKMLACAVDAAIQKGNLTVRTAYAAMLLNRCESPLFPNSLSAVIACTVPNTSYGTPPSSLSLAAARAAAIGVDPTSGALYCKPSGDPKMYRSQTIDGYDFYK